MATLILIKVLLSRYFKYGQESAVILFFCFLGTVMATLILIKVLLSRYFKYGQESAVILFFVS